MNASPLPSFAVNTQSMPRNAALELWQQLSGTIYHTRLINEERFFASASGVQLDDMLLLQCQSTSQTFDRSRRQIAADGHDHFYIQFNRQGEWWRRDGRGNVVGRPGDMIVQDTAQPHSSVASDFNNLSLQLPRRLLTGLLRTPDEHNMQVVDSGQPLVALLRHHLEQLIVLTPTMTVSQASAIVQPTLELVAAALNGRVAEEQMPSIDVALGETIRHYVRQHALDSQMSPATIATHFGISVRKLAYLFEADGGVATYLRSWRLHLSRQVLIDPQWHHLSISEIALAHGFSHVSVFSRAFRHYYGVSPREVRYESRARTESFYIPALPLWERFTPLDG